MTVLICYLHVGFEPTISHFKWGRCPGYLDSTWEKGPDGIPHYHPTLGQAAKIQTLVCNAQATHSLSHSLVFIVYDGTQNVKYCIQCDWINKNLSDVWAN